MKKKYQVIIGLLLSMTAIFMLSCEDVMTENLAKGENGVSVDQGQNGERFITSAYFYSKSKVGTMIYITVRATGQQEGNVTTLWRGSSFNNLGNGGPYLVSGSGQNRVCDYFYQIDASASNGQGTFRWMSGNADISCSF